MHFGITWGSDVWICFFQERIRSSGTTRFSKLGSFSCSSRLISAYSVPWRDVSRKRLQLCARIRTCSIASGKAAAVVFGEGSGNTSSLQATIDANLTSGSHDIYSFRSAYYSTMIENETLRVQFYCLYTVIFYGKCILFAWKKRKNILILFLLSPDILLLTSAFVERLFTLVDVRSSGVMNRETIVRYKEDKGESESKF